VLRGLLFGMFSFVSFFFTLGIMLGRLSIGASFIVATMITLLIQGITLQILPVKTR
jgi:hypothetical protein